MRKRSRIRNFVAAVLVIAGVALMSLALVRTHSPGDVEVESRRLEKRISHKISVLDRAALKVFEEGTVPEKMPSDEFVLYRYVDDSLESWTGRFFLNNDDISRKYLVQRLTNPRSVMFSPLSDVTGDWTFQNFGPGWYLVKKVSRDGVTVIEGLEISEIPDGRYSVRPLSFSGGCPVTVDGEPRFKLLRDSLYGSQDEGEWLLWSAFFCFVAGLVFFLLASPTIRRLLIVVPSVLLVVALALAWTSASSAGSGFFSPVLYADSEFLPSLGAMVFLNITVFVLSLSLFITRRSIAMRLKTRPSMIVTVLLDTLAVSGIGVYSFTALRSLILNSGISAELYKFSELNSYGALVYLSFVTLLLSIPLLLQLMQPLSVRLWGRHLNFLSRGGRIVFAALISLYMVTVTSVFGFRKEESRLEVWANRLAVTRDIGLEMRLRAAERQIAEDPVVASLSMLDNAGATIRNRLGETSLSRISQDYEIFVTVNPPDISRMSDGEPIYDNSRFVYKENKAGYASYSGLFLYMVEGYGIVRLIIDVERKGDWKNRGYSGILGLSPPGGVAMPSSYAYARYAQSRLMNFRGNYPYPVVMDDALYTEVYDGRTNRIKRDGYTHFIYEVSEGEAVIISRASVGVLYYAMVSIFIGLLVFFALMSFSGRRVHDRALSRRYFKGRIIWVIMISLTLTLVALAAVSVLFVYNRNENARRTLMSEKINSIQSQLSSRIRGAGKTSDLMSQDVRRLLEDVGDNTNSDIVLYSPSGMAFMSTDPMVFDRMLVESRMDGHAHRVVTGEHRRYYIQKEKIGGKMVYSMYAPLSGDNGRTIAIICAPYTEENYDFKTDLINHAVFIVSVFLFLLLVARFMTSSVLDRMFRPLLVMGRKMNKMNIDSLEYISYDKEDEISTLVNAYNRMVSELSESTGRLAQAERDKAWSGMARQVAHEIKNPLTPMKLQIQRLVRLKERNDPSWKERFDEVAGVLLDHIDILTETANEFSTFARLYTEEPVSFDLDRVLREEIAMFDGRDDVSFDYMGFSEAVVNGPKPQLTRVFVNLINNAVQAVESSGEGRVLVSLRNSSTDGFYDIVVEDNGPGVAEENISRLFTPNFTTKTGGSGLGLAISRSILERCGASISYGRSFVLGGACFTVMYPKS